MRLNGRLYSAEQNDFILATEKFDARLNKLDKVTVGQPMNDLMLGLASLVSPIDLDTGKPLDTDEFRRTAKAITVGGIIGYYLNLDAYDPTTIIYHDIAKNIPSYNDPNLDEAENRMRTGHYLVEAGMSAMDSLGNDVNAWIETHEERLVTDVRAQRYVRIGCGIITLATRSAFDNALEDYQKKDLELFENELVEGTVIDWDAIDWSGPVEKE